MSLCHDLQKGKRPGFPTCSLSACAPLGERNEMKHVHGALSPSSLLPQEFAPSDEELDSYRRGEEWDPQKAEEKRKLKVSYA